MTVVSDTIGLGLSNSSLGPAATLPALRHPVSRWPPSGLSCYANLSRACARWRDPTCALPALVALGDVHFLALSGHLFLHRVSAYRGKADIRAASYVQGGSADTMISGFNSKDNWRSIQKSPPFFFYDTSGHWAGSRGFRRLRR